MVRALSGSWDTIDVLACLHMRVKRDFREGERDREREKDNILLELNSVAASPLSS